MLATTLIGKLCTNKLEKTLSLSGRLSLYRRGKVILIEKEIFMVKKEENPITKLFIPKAAKIVSLKIIVAPAAPRGPVDEQLQVL